MSRCFVVYYGYRSMTITYPKGDNEYAGGSAAPSGGSPHLTAIAIAVSIVFIVVATGLWFGFSQSQKAIESVPAAVIPPKSTPAVAQARVYEATDGLKQCQKNTPDLATADARQKRQNCYYAVMTVFATSAICDITSLDATSADLCRQAVARFVKDYPNGVPLDQPSASAPSSAPGGTSQTANGAATGHGTTGGVNKNTNTNSGGANSNTNTSSGTSNTNSVSATNTNSSGNTNSAGTGPTSGNQNGNTNTSTNTKPLCVNDPGTVTLLEHTNDCQ